MPPTYLSRQDQAVRLMADPANKVRGMASQQQIDIATSTSEVALRTGVLYQFPSSGSPTNYTSGYGLEVLSAGSGSAPVLRAGVLTWVSPSGGTKTVVGLCFFDTSGNLRVAMTGTGWVLYDTSGNVTSTLASY